MDISPLVVEFIKAERSKGVPDQTIRIMLSANGWTAYDMAQAYKSIDNNSTVNSNYHHADRSLLGGFVHGFFRGLLYSLIIGLIITVVVLFFLGKIGNI